MKPRSLIRRTITLVLLAELFCAIAFSVSALEHERNTRLRALDIQIRGRSDTVAGSVRDAEDPDDNVTMDPLDPTELRLPPTDVYAVYNLGGSLIASSPNPPAALIARQGDGFTDRIAAGAHFRVLQRNVTRIIDRDEPGGATVRRVTVLYASSKQHILHELAEAARFYLAVSLVSLALTAAFLIVSLRRTLAPLRQLAEAAASVTARDPHFEAPASALTVRELQPLAQTLQVSIQGLRQALENEHRFVGDAAHELKTAVAVVRSTIQVLMLRPRSVEEHTRGLDTLLTDNQRVEDLVARMLLLARMEEKPPPHQASADLSSVASALILRIASFARLREVTLTAAIPQPAIAAISPERADLLLSNLVINAIQHSPRGAMVQITTSHHPETIEIHVQDHGDGISPQALPHIFQRFFRQDSSRSRETGGAGLGLAICKSIVDNAGGVIAVQSREAAGTTVTVTLPT